MFDEITLAGNNNTMGYLIKYPTVGLKEVDVFLRELVEDAEYYLNNAFQVKMAEKLVKHKKGRVYCDFCVTYNGEGVISILLLMSGYDGCELVCFDYDCIVLNKEGDMLPEWFFNKEKRGRKKCRSYYINKERNICVSEKTSEIPRVKIPREKLQGLVAVKEKYEWII